MQIPSLSGQEREVNAELAAQLEAAGFDEVSIDPLGNCIGRIGHGPRLLAIDAHMDTVDVGERGQLELRPLLGGEVRDGFVHGRGSVDQEGGAAAFVTAGRILRELGFGDDLTLLCTGTVMEEDCDGLCWKYLIEEGGLRPDLVISTEPTNLRVYRGHRGRMEIAVSLPGQDLPRLRPRARGQRHLHGLAPCLEIERLNPRLAVDPFLGKGSVDRLAVPFLESLSVRGGRRGPPASRPPPHRGGDRESAPWPRSRHSWRAGRHGRGPALRGPRLHGPALRHAQVLPHLGAAEDHPAVREGRDRGASSSARRPRSAAGPSPPTA